MTTLKEALESLKFFPKIQFKSKGSIAEALLGKYMGIIPKGKSSTQLIQQSRLKLYGKIK